MPLTAEAILALVNLIQDVIKYATPASQIQALRVQLAAQVQADVQSEINALGK